MATGKNKTNSNWLFNDVLFSSEKSKGLGGKVSKRAMGKAINKGNKATTKKAGNK